MSFEGNITGNNVLQGNVYKPSVIHGKSAFEIAVINGFSGTEEEWLESLKGKDGAKGADGVTPQLRINSQTNEWEVLYPGNMGVGVISGVWIPLGVKATGDRGEDGKDATRRRLANIELLASAWVGSASPYSQVVPIEGITENSQVDLTPSVEQLVIFRQKDLAFVTENEDGVVTVYAIGDKPQNDYTIQATITEVMV